MIKKLLILFLATIFSSCATLFTGSSDPIRFTSNPPDAKVFIDNAYVGNTPCTIEVDRKYKPMYATFSRDGYESESVLLSKDFNYVCLLDLFTFIGTVVDLATANVLRYDQLYYSFNMRKNNKDEYIIKEPRSTEKIEKQLIGTGSGFLISANGFIATNYHLVEGSTLIEVYFPKDNLYSKYNAHLVATDISNDLAILEIVNDGDKFELVPPYKFDFGYEIGEDVFTIGYPVPMALGTDFKMTKGEINALSGYKNDRSCMQISVPLQPGNSGGPLFNSAGNLVGITSSKVNDEKFYENTGTIAQSINYAIKIDYLNVLTKNVTNLSIPEISHIEKVMDFKQKVKILKDYVALIAVYE